MSTDLRRHSSNRAPIGAAPSIGESMSIDGNSVATGAVVGTSTATEMLAGAAKTAGARAGGAGVCRVTEISSVPVIMGGGRRQKRRIVTTEVTFHRFLLLTSDDEVIVMIEGLTSTRTAASWIKL